MAKSPFQDPLALWRDMLGEASEHVGAVWAVTHEVVTNSAAAGTPACPPSSTCEFEEHTNTWTSCAFWKNASASLDAGALAPGGWLVQAWGDVSCQRGSSHSISAQLLGDTVPILEVPLIELPEGVQQPWVVL